MSKLKEKRKLLKATQKEVARACNITQATYSRIENGKAKGISKETMHKIFCYLNMDPKELAEVRKKAMQGKKIKLQAFTGEAYAVFKQYALNPKSATVDSRWVDDWCNRYEEWFING